MTLTTHFDVLKCVEDMINLYVIKSPWQQIHLQLRVFLFADKLYESVSWETTTLLEKKRAAIQKQSLLEIHKTTSKR